MTDMHKNILKHPDQTKIDMHTLSNVLTQRETADSDTVALHDLEN